MVYGLTGGTGSGKTTVANFLTEMGYTVIDADVIARSLTDPGSEVLRLLAETFGEEILAEDGSLIRKRLGDIVFNNKEKLQQLNDIMGPSMDKAFLKALNDAVLERPYSKVFFDAPTLYESGREYMVDKVWVVAAGLETRIRRIMDRDGLSREQVLARMANQLPEEEKIRRADVVIYNDGTLEDLRCAVEKALK
ncbi:MAG: dephospho-CoA kinase [Firmicutes bacterium]|nr:dephospho-CoA kinase [Bacillota bacterium]MBQ3931726.1 dephospho-CoA kinase [Bacillota bacterium]